MTKVGKKNLVVKNFKYMFPLLLKKSPQTIILMIVSAFVNSARSIFNVVIGISLK